VHERKSGGSAPEVAIFTYYPVQAAIFSFLYFRNAGSVREMLSERLLHESVRAHVKEKTNLVSAGEEVEGGDQIQGPWLVEKC
jgi:hypothetical protein